MSGDTLSGLDLGATIRGFAAGQVVFERYRLDHILGRGGMGVVWLAHDQELNEQIALKFLPEAVRLDALALEELKRETRKSRKLTHRNIVRVYSFVSDSHCAGISMEWIDGSTLSELRLTKPNMVFQPEELKPWVKQVCEALEYAHTVARLIHRDLKPAHVMLNSAGEAKITDFGISSSLTESASRVSVQAGSGTLAYMSPQQALGERPRVSDDVYALGATLYELITGKPPFFRGDLYAQVRDVVPPPMAQRRAEAEIPADGIPDQWEAAIADCLAKDPAKRPQSALEVAWRLGLVKDFERKAAVELPKTEIVRVTTLGASSPDTATVPPTATTVTPPTQTTRPTIPVFTPQPARISPHLIAVGALILLLFAATLWAFLRPPPAPIAQVITSSPTPPTSVPTPTPTTTPIPTAAPTVAPAIAVAPSAPPASSAAPASVSTPIPAPSAIASAAHALPANATQLVASTPGSLAAPLVSNTVAPPYTSSTLAAPLISGSLAAPSTSGSLAIPVVDHQLIGHWITGATRATRTRWALQADGQYILAISGTVSDTGIMSATNGQITAFSKDNSTPSSITYTFDDDDLITQGDGPFDAATWHRVTTTSHHSTGSDEPTHSTMGQKIHNGLSSLRHLF